jgi:hypothetical protein
MDTPLRTKGVRTIFLKDQENLLVTRIVMLFACAFEWDLRQKCYLQFCGIKCNTIQEIKMSRFDRLEVIALRRGEGLSLARCSVLNRHDVVEYFSSLRETTEKFDIMNKAEVIYIADESCCQPNNKLTKEVRPYTHKLVTVLACEIMLAISFRQQDLISSLL